MKAITRYHEQRDWKIETLSRIASEILPGTVPEQRRYKVTETPGPRTLRYYRTQGLLDEPHSYEGGFARFGYRHLLQILAIKRLQADYLPIRKIREILPGRTEEELMGIIRDGTFEPSSGPGLGDGLLRAILGRRTASPHHPAAWTRAELAPGIEVHLRDDLDRRRISVPEITRRLEEVLRRAKGEDR